jgi:hypothetical protein
MAEPTISADSLRTLTDMACNGAITEEDAAQLERLLRGNAQAQQFYLKRMSFDTWLRWEVADQVQEPTSVDSPPPVIVSVGSPYGRAGWLSSGWPVAYLVAAVVLGIGLMIGAVTHVSQSIQVVRQHLPSTFGRRAGGEGGRTVDATQSPVVGQITGTLDCRFAAGSKTEERRTKAVICLGDRLDLVSGLLEITYNTGTRVILQGPVTYEIESPAGGYLSVGRLTAKVDKRLEIRDKSPDIPHPSSLIPHPLFVVRTPNAVVTDLGTEFGVEVTRSGETTSHVFRGLVRVQRTGADGTVEPEGRTVGENQTVRIESSAGSRQIVALHSFSPSHFVREIPRRTIMVFDLVDVVAGGDGFSGRRNRGINPLTGRTTDVSQLEAEYNDGDRRYHRVAGMPYVDGVFVPDGGSGPVQIASTGLSFDGFPKTSNETAHAIWAGGVVSAGSPKYPTPRTVLDGVDYSSAGHGLLFLHANKGITFDLGAIRRANPGCKLLRFRAVAGNTEFGSEQGKAVYADVWVLIDGQTRFRRREINGPNGGFAVALPIEEKDRFLTLAATDAGNEISWDWIIFGDPRLEMLSTGAGAADDRPQEPSARSRVR